MTIITYEQVRDALSADQRAEFDHDAAALSWMTDGDFISQWEQWRQNAGIPDGVLANERVITEALPPDMRRVFAHILTLSQITAEMIEVWEHWRLRAHKAAASLGLTQVRDALPQERREEFDLEMQSLGLSGPAIDAWERWRCLVSPPIPAQVLAAAARMMDFAEQRAIQPGVDPDLLYTVSSYVVREPAQLRLSDVATLVRHSGFPEGPLPISTRHSGPYREIHTCAGRPYCVQRVGTADGHRYAIYDMGVTNVLDPNSPTMLADDPAGASRAIREHRAAHGPATAPAAAA